MGNTQYDRIKKLLAILLVVLFLISVTAASVDAKPNVYHSKDISYKKGYSDGEKKGERDGKKDGAKDCTRHGRANVLKKMPGPFNKKNWTGEYKTRYNDGYRAGYLKGYNHERYSCLKNK